MEAILTRNHRERQAVRQSQSAVRIGNQVMPRSPMDLTGSTTHRDLGGFHEGNMGSTQGDNRAVAAQYANHKQNANTITRKLSATKYGNQVMPRSPMDLTGSTTHRDLGGFYEGKYGQGASVPAGPSEATPIRGNDIMTRGTQAFPRGTMSFADSTTNRDLGSFY